MCFLRCGKYVFSPNHFRMDSFNTTLQPSPYLIMMICIKIYSVFETNVVKVTQKLELQNSGNLS